MQRKIVFIGLFTFLFCGVIAESAWLSRCSDIRWQAGAGVVYALTKLAFKELPLFVGKNILKNTFMVETSEQRLHRSAEASVHTTCFAVTCKTAALAVKNGKLVGSIESTVSQTFCPLRALVYVGKTAFNATAHLHFLAECVRVAKIAERVITCVHKAITWLRR